MLLELDLLIGYFIHVQHNYEKILMFELGTFTVLRYLGFNLLIVIAILGIRFILLLKVNTKS